MEYADSDLKDSTNKGQLALRMGIAIMVGVAFTALFFGAPLVNNIIDSLVSGEMERMILFFILGLLLLIIAFGSGFFLMSVVSMFAGQIINKIRSNKLLFNISLFIIYFLFAVAILLFQNISVASLKGNIARISVIMMMSAIIITRILMALAPPYRLINTFIGAVVLLVDLVSILY